MLTLALALCVLLAQTPQPDSKTGLDAEQLSYSVALDPMPIQRALLAVSAAARKPGGVVLLSLCGEEDESPLQVPQGASLVSALDLLTAVHPAYEWTVRDGVVNVLPRQQKFAVMNVLLGRFGWDATDSVHLSVSRLSQVPSVRQFLRGTGVVEAIQQVSLFGRLRRTANGISEPPPKGRRYVVESVPLVTALNRSKRSEHSSYENQR